MHDQVVPHKLHRSIAMLRLRCRAAALPCLSAVLGLLLCPAVDAAEETRDLTDILPRDSFWMTYVADDPSMQHAYEATHRVFDAILDARFDDLVFDVMQAGGARSDAIVEMRQARDMVASLLGGVPWSDLVKNEAVFAQTMRAAFPVLPVLIPSTLMGFRPDADKVEGLERSLRTLLSTVAAISDGYFSLDSSGDDTPDGTRIYELTIPKYNTSVVQLAFRQDYVVAAVGQETFLEALALLEGKRKNGLTSTSRYAQAFGELPRVSNHSFCDFQAIINGVQDTLMSIAVVSEGNDDISLMRVVFNEVSELVGCFDTLATIQRAEGRSLITESYLRFDRMAAKERNPLYMSLARGGTCDDLLGYVPADAIQFYADNGTDISPIYEWCRGKLKKYMPNAKDILVTLDTAEALLGLDVEDDLFEWLGSAELMGTIPARRPSATHTEDWVILSRMGNPKSAREIMRRLENAFTVFVPPMIDQVRSELGAVTELALVGNVVRSLDPRLEDAHGVFPSLRKLSLTSNNLVPPVTYGFMGDLFVATSSEEALEYVLGVGEGEYPGLEDHDAAQGGALGADGVTSAVLMDNAKILKETIEGMASASGMMQVVLAQAARHDPKAKSMVQAMSGFMPRLQRVFEATDVVRDTMSYVSFREEGLARYTRKTSRLKDF